MKTTQTVLLGDEIELAYGKGLPQRDRVSGKYPVYGSNGQVDTHNKSLVNGPGIIVGRKGSVGEVIWSEKDFWPIDTTYYVKLKNTDDDLRYWYYQLKTLGLNKLNTHSAIPGLNRDVAYAKLVIRRTPYEQKKIADILGKLDEKIELNRKMNETLEQMGQALFKHYFITNPASKEWKNGHISDLGRVVTGKTPSKSNSNFYGEGIPFLKVPDMHGKSIVINTADNLTLSGADSQRNKYIPKWSTAVSCIASVGVVSLLGQQVQTNQQINSIIPNNESYRYFNYYLMREKAMYIEVLASSGSATPNLNKTQFEKIGVQLPPAGLLEKFDAATLNIFESIYTNVEQIQTLTTLRDTLLPRLISGKVKLDNE